MINLETMETRLRAELAVVEKELSELGTIDPTVPGDWIAKPPSNEGTDADENIVADRSEEWIERSGELALLETRLNNLQRAVQKISEGQYGNCELCGAAIEEKRLDANPAARTCLTHLEDEAQLPL